MGLFSRNKIVTTAPTQANANRPSGDGPTTFGDLARALEGHGVLLFLDGIFNVESGDVGVGNQFFPNCEACYGSSDTAFEVRCSDCGRAPGNYAWLKSGFGDGVYVTFRLLVERGQEWDTIGFLSVFDFDSDFSRPVVEAAIELQSMDTSMEVLENFHGLNWIPVGTLHVTDEVIIADKMHSADKDGAAIVVYFDEDVAPERELELMAYFNADGEAFDEGRGTLRPRMLVGLDREIYRRLPRQQSLAVPDRESLARRWLFEGIDLCHLSPRQEVAYWYNFQLRMAGEQFLGALGWLLKGARWGDQDCSKELADVDLSDKRDTVAALLLMHGEVEAAQYWMEHGQLLRS